STLAAIEGVKNNSFAIRRCPAGAPVGFEVTVGKVTRHLDMRTRCRIRSHRLINGYAAGAGGAALGRIVGDTPDHRDIINAYVSAVYGSESALRTSIRNVVSKDNVMNFLRR